MTFTKQYLPSRVIIGLMALAMSAATLPAYGDPTLNPGLTTLTEPAVSLGQTAGAFLGRQLTLIVIALMGAIGGQRQWVMLGGFGMFFMNGHDAIFMGLFGGPLPATVGGAVFSALAGLSIFWVWRQPAAS